MPGELSSFVGREHELAELTRKLATTRLLTLVGAGWVGRTRLALQVARPVLDEYPDGVWLLELTSAPPGRLTSFKMHVCQVEVAHAPMPIQTVVLEHVKCIQRVFQPYAPAPVQHVQVEAIVPKRLKLRWHWEAARRMSVVVIAACRLLAPGEGATMRAVPRRPAPAHRSEDRRQHVLRS